MKEQLQKELKELYKIANDLVNKGVCLDHTRLANRMSEILKKLDELED